MRGIIWSSRQRPKDLSARASPPGYRDNTIGSTPQLNELAPDWVEFFRERRLRYQLALAQENGYGGALQQLGAGLLERMGAFFASYRPRPSLLHGDLWGGNRGVDGNGEPVIFAPAVYFGDREADSAPATWLGLSRCSGVCWPS